MEIVLSKCLEIELNFSRHSDIVYEDFGTNGEFYNENIGQFVRLCVAVADKNLL